MTLRQPTARAALTLLVACLATSALAQEWAGTLAVSFDPDTTDPVLEDAAVGTIFQFFVVAEQIGEPGLDGVSYQFIGSSNLQILVLQSSLDGSSLQQSGFNTWRVDQAGLACAAPAADGRIEVATGFGIINAAGPGSLALAALDSLEAASWDQCDGPTFAFAALEDGLVGEDGSPACEVSQSELDLGQIVPGETAAADLAITNVGGGVLTGEVPASCGPFEVVIGAGPFELLAGQTLVATVAVTPDAPGGYACDLDLGLDCGLVSLQVEVVEESELGDPGGRLVFYLNPALTDTSVAGLPPGEPFTFYAVLEDLPADTGLDGWEFAVEPDQPLVILSAEALPVGATLLAGGGPEDGSAFLADCLVPDPGTQVPLVAFTALGLASDPLGSFVTINADRSSQSTLLDGPGWFDCTGLAHRFATVVPGRAGFGDTSFCLSIPASLDFGTVYVGNERVLPLLLQNTTTDVATGEVVLADCPGLELVSGGGLFELAPQEVRTIELRFAPTVPGDVACELFVTGACTDPVTITGSSREPLPQEAPLGTAGVFFDPELTQTTFQPTSAAESITAYLAVTELPEGTSPAGGFELVIEADFDALFLGSDPPASASGFDPESLRQTITWMVELPDCPEPDAQGNVVLAQLQFLYLPFFGDNPDGIAITLTAADGSRFDPPAPGWAGCDDLAYPFALTLTSTVLPVDLAVPAAPSGFVAEPADAGEVVLSWDAQADAASFRVFRGDAPDFTPHQTNLMAETDGTSHVDVLPEGEVAYYRLQAVGANGMGGEAVAPASPTAVATATPAAVRLLGAAPNPFNPRTNIRFELPDDLPVHLQVFDLRGRLVRTLVDAPLTAGRQEIAWDGRDQAGRNVGAGTYLYRLEAGEFTGAGRMLLVK